MSCAVCGKPYSPEFKRYIIRKGSEEIEVFICPECLKQIERLSSLERSYWTKEDALGLKRIIKNVIGFLGKVGIVLLATVFSFGLWLLKQGLKAEEEWQESFAAELDDLRGYEVSDEEGNVWLSDDGINYLESESFEEVEYDWTDLAEESFSEEDIDFSDEEGF